MITIGQRYKNKHDDNILEITDVVKPPKEPVKIDVKYLVSGTKTTARYLLQDFEKSVEKGVWVLQPD